MDPTVWRSMIGQATEAMKRPRGRMFGGAVVALLAVAASFALIHQDQSQQQATASTTEETCSNGPGGDRVGYLRTVLLCPVDSPQCKPDQRRVFKARRSGGWNAEAMLIPDIPDGYVITGGDMVDPSPYRITNMGFNGVKVTSYTNATDYCTQHYWYYLHANWISSEPTDRARISICVYYDKWNGAKPSEACPAPEAYPPQ